MIEIQEDPANAAGLDQTSASSEAVPPPYEALLQTVAELRATNSDLRDKHLRAVAEMENFRRRAEREKSDGMKYAIGDFARDIVSIGDNLRRAIDAAKKESPEDNSGLKTLLDGVEVTERELLKVFERHGVTRFDPLGEKFDPHVHEAMVKVDVPNVAAETVVQVLQAGYRINDRVLRPAAVIVAKGGTPAPADKKFSERSMSGTLAEAADLRSSKPAPASVKPASPQSSRETQAQAEFKNAAAEKKQSTVTQPIKDSSAATNKDDLISSFGKRLDS